MKIRVHSIIPAQPSNANRDDLGHVKTSVYGGTVRARWSPQSREAVMRKEFAKRVAGNRGESTFTVELVNLLSAAIRDVEPSTSPEDADRLAVAAFGDLTKSGERQKAEEKAESKKLLLEAALDALREAEEDSNLSDSKRDQLTTKVSRAQETYDRAVEAAEKKGAMWLVSPAQIRAAAEVIARADSEGLTGNKFPQNDLIEAMKSKPSLDSAAFGRMFAAKEAQKLNIDAAVQVAHSLGVNEFSPDVDFFTAVDRISKVARVMDYNHLSSPIMYCYSSVDVKLLANNLGMDSYSDEFREALKILVEMLATAAPQGRETKAGSIARPTSVYLTAGDGGGILSAGFLGTVEDDVSALSNLLATADGYARGYGDDFDSQALWTLHAGSVAEEFRDHVMDSVGDAIDRVVSSATKE